MTAFSVLRFSPDPEITEFINVALCVWERRVRVVYEPEFPKLNCIAPSFPEALLRAYLDTLSDRLAAVQPDGAQRVIQSLSSQFQLLQPRELVSGASKEVVEGLKQKYLARHAVKRGEPWRARVAPQLDALLGGLEVNAEWMKKRVRLKSVLGAKARKVLNGSDVTVTRVYNHPERLVLLEGLDLRDRDPRAVAQSISYEFFKVKKVQPRLEQLEQRKVIRAAVLFHSNLEEQSDRTEHAAHIVELESDSFFDLQRDKKSLLQRMLAAGPDAH